MSDNSDGEFSVFRRLLCSLGYMINACPTDQTAASARIQTRRKQMYAYDHWQAVYSRHSDVRDGSSIE